ncbi:MAG: hypothetical protein QOF29_3376 [bacterium]
MTITVTHEAVSASAPLTLLGTLTNAGGGRYRAPFTGVEHPGTVRVESSLGGSASRTVSLE